MSRYEEYQICKKRKHQAQGGGIRFGNIDWNVCVFCHAWFRYETKVIEDKVPNENE